MKLFASYFKPSWAVNNGALLNIIAHFLNLWSFAFGNVKVTKPHHPLYVQTGHALELVCNSAQRTTLQWARETPGTSWRDTLIVPTVGSDFMSRNCVEEPEGVVQSSMLMKRLQLQDRGLYICRDQSQEYSFAVWVTMLHVYTKNVTVEPDHSHVALVCMISGFEANIPDIQYAWTKDGEDLSGHGNKYEMVMLPGSPEKSSLVIQTPVHSDHGVYACSFTLETDKGPLILKEEIHVDASSLDQRSMACLLCFRPLMMTVTFFTSLLLIIQ